MTNSQVLLAAISFALTLFFGGVWVFQTHGIYKFDQSPQLPQSFGLVGVRVLPFISEDGTPALAWMAPPASGSPILFSFYGNSSAIGPAMLRLAPLMADGTGIVMLQYRGSGGMNGHPSEENFARDARALYDQLDMLAGQTIPQDRRVLHGFSLGAGVAARLALERPFAGLVLEASLPRACMYYQQRYQGFPFCALMWAERYDVIDWIGKVSAPKLFVHGTADVIVPTAWGKELYATASAPKDFVELPGGSHADLTHYGLIPVMKDFITQHVK